MTTVPVHTRPSLVREFGIACLAWTVFALVGMAQAYMSQLALGEAPPPLRTLATWSFGSALVWAVATPGVLRISRRFPLRLRRLPCSLPPHLGVVAVLAAVHAALELVIWTYLEAVAYPTGTGAFVAGTFRQLSRTVVLYAAVVAIGYALDYQRRLREREVREARLEGQLATARLEALRSQLQPHFLFNALNTVAMHVRETGSREALRVVLGLSELLRRVLRSEAQETSLEQELELLELYLSIERARFGERLRVEVEVESEARRARVPTLLLQPLVENAVRHGLAGRDGGRIRVAAGVEAGRLRLVVADDGRGFPADAEEGVGLSNTRRRLEQLHPGDHRFEVAAAAPGTIVRLDLPFRPVDDRPADLIGAADGIDTYAHR